MLLSAHNSLPGSTLPDCIKGLDWCSSAARGQTRLETLKQNQSMTVKKQNTRMQSHTAQLSGTCTVTLPACPYSCGSVCSWIVLWQTKGGAAQAVSAAACKEAEADDSGRFNGKCTAVFTSVFYGLSIQVCTTAQEFLLMKKYQVSIQQYCLHFICMLSMTCTGHLCW